MVDILVGVPVYRGADVVAETLESIRRQSYEGIRVLISVDGDDQRSADACRTFLEDDRFEMVVHPNRLGWARNYNWMVRQARLPFFLFWAQDDLADPDLLAQLHETMVSEPAASVAFADIQWFGGRSDLESTPSIVGSRRQRVRTAVERLRHEPMHGLIRTSYLDRTRDPLKITPDDSCQEEFVLLARLAARGPLRRVEDPLYWKRSHPGSEHRRFRDFPEYRGRRGWMSMGHGLVDVLTDIEEATSREAIVEFVAERLAVHLPPRDFFYLPLQTDDEIARFSREFVSRLHREPDAAEMATNPIVGRPIQRAVRLGLDLDSQARDMRAELSAAVARLGGATWLVQQGQSGESLLGTGWCKWDGGDGVWSDGDEATLVLPHLGQGRWSVSVSGHPMGRPGSEVRIRWTLGDETGVVTLAADTHGLIETVADWPGGEPELILAFRDASSPRALGLSEDGRHLGFFVTSVEVSRA